MNACHRIQNKKKIEYNVYDSQVAVGRLENLKKAFEFKQISTDVTMFYNLHIHNAQAYTILRSQRSTKSFFFCSQYSGIF